MSWLACFVHVASLTGKTGVFGLGGRRHFLVLKYLILAVTKKAE
jgi:hypothetical protein